MRREVFFLPLIGLAGLAAYLGFQRGQIPTETAIINRYVSVYLANADGQAKPTDCAATPHPDAAIRMVIYCAHPSGVTTTFYAGPRGDAVPVPSGPSI